MNNTGHRLVLASASPRRRQILESLQAVFEVRAAPIPEERLDGEAPEQMVARLAEEKARAVARVLQREAIVLGADTAVVLDSEVYGKPESQADALRMLAQLSGRTHRVLSGVALVAAGKTSRAISETEVRFRDIHPDEALRYWQSGEPRGKAGAYAIQGFGGLFVESIMGSYSGVVGLPVFETAGLLSAAGYELLPGTGQQDE